jgi:hypothetical protein
MDTTVKSALQESRFDSKTQRWVSFPLYPSLEGHVVGVRDGQTNVAWHLSQEVVRLERTDDPDQPYRRVIERTPTTLSYWTLNQFLVKSLRPEVTASSNTSFK